MATTGADGFFTLAVDGSSVLLGNEKLLPNCLSARIIGDMITIAIAKKTTVVISAFDFCGRSVFYYT
jgi:hypothetical protein